MRAAAVARAALALAVGTGLAGCHRGDRAGPAQAAPMAVKKPGESGYDTAPQVLVQLCLPSRKVEFEILPVDLAYLEEARKTGRYAGIADLTPQQLAEVDKNVRQAKLSDAPDGVRLYDMPSDAFTRDGGNGPSGLQLNDSTALGQPVFQSYGYHAENFALIRVFTMNSQGAKAGPPYFWFQVPQAVGDAWTAWEPPKAEWPVVSSELDWQALRRRDVDPTPIASADAPRMRFRMVSYREWEAARRRWEPAEKAVRQQVHPGDGVRLQPQSGAIIPGC